MDINPACAVCLARAAQEKANGSRGGHSRALRMTAARRSEVAREAARVRWGKAKEVKP